MKKILFGFSVFAQHFLDFCLRQRHAGKRETGLQVVFKDSLSRIRVIQMDFCHQGNLALFDKRERDMCREFS